MAEVASRKDSAFLAEDVTLTFSPVRLSRLIWVRSFALEEAVEGLGSAESSSAVAVRGAIPRRRRAPKKTSFPTCSPLLFFSKLSMESLDFNFVSGFQLFLRPSPGARLNPSNPGERTSFFQPKAGPPSDGDFPQGN